MQNKVLKKATDHFKVALASEMKSIEVPEWETTVYYKPALTLAQQTKVLEYHNKGKLVDALVETLIIRARHEDGKPMFQSGERQIIINEVDPDVLTRIVTEMNAGANQAEAQLGN